VGAYAQKVCGAWVCMCMQSVCIHIEEEEEEDLFVFNDTIEGPRAPAVKP
jgi:hypothetical protein